MRDQLSLNMSVARSCFVMCKGCYNHFGKNSNIITSDQILSFLELIKEYDVNKVTLCGGDPLSRPNIFELLEDIKELDFFINLDTVGTSFLNDTKTIFFGNSDIKNVSAQKVSDLVDLLGIPVDGSTNEIMALFRKGRPNIFDEQVQILDLLEEAKADVCINTVIHKHNLEDAPNIWNAIKGYDAVKKWQVFQYMPTGPLGFKNRDYYQIEGKVFSSFQENMNDVCGESKIQIDLKANAERKGNYLLVDTDGIAWTPATSMNDNWNAELDATKERIILGNIKEAKDHKKIIETMFNPSKLRHG